MITKKNKNNLLYISIISVLCFTILNYNYHTKANENIIKEKYNNYKKKYKIDNHQNCFQYFRKYKNQYSNQMNKIIYSLTPNYFTSKIQINNNSLNLINIYLQNTEQLIFNQLGLHLINDKKIYNFGVGYRKNFYNQWYIGNNLFYDSILLKHNKKNLSIGSEFFKNTIYVATNTYYNLSNNNFIYTNHKKYIPYAYDIYTKYPLPIFPKTFGTINIEHHLNNKNCSNDIISQHIYNIIDKKNFYNPSKLILGIVYTPISALSININKTIFNSKKNYETKINIVANYKINIPWIYQTKHIINNYHKNTFLSNTKYSIINRNNTMILDYSIDIYKKIKIFNFNELSYQEIPPSNTSVPETKNIILQNTNKYNKQSIQKQESIILQLKKTHYVFQLPCSNTQINIKNTSSFIHQKNQHQPLNKKTPTIDTITPNINLQTISKNTTSQENLINVISKNSTDDTYNKINNNTYLKQEKNYNNTTIQKNDINNSHNCLPLKISETNQQTMSIIIQQQKISSNDNNYNIPPPPPISEFLKNTNHYEILENRNIMNQNTETNKYTDSYSQIEKINKHKQKNFSSLGSQEHILKLDNIIKKRKKTTSTSSNDSNNSESLTLLKIIERQSALTLQDDTDSDDQNSINSNNEFSE